MKNYTTTAIIALICLFVQSISIAQTTCATSLPVTINGACITGATVNDATQNAPNLNASCGTVSFKHERWYTFTVANGPLNVTISAQSADRNLYLQLISSTAACTGLAQIDCANADTNSNSAQSENITQTLANGIYYLKVVNVGGGTSMTLNSLCITAPANACASTTNIASCGTTINTTLPAADGMYGSFACGYGTSGSEKIFSFTPTTTGYYSIEQFSSTDTVNYQFKPASNGCNGNNWLCVGDMFDASVSYPILLSAGVSYYFMADSYSNAGVTASFTINCSNIVENNDECSNATYVSANSLNTCTFSVSGTTVGATESQPACSGTADDDVWYTFQAISSTHIITVTPGTLSNAVIEVFDGTCDSGLTQMSCQDITAGSTAETTTLTGLIVGNFYLVRVHSFAASVGQGTFTFCVSSPPNPCNSITNVNACGVAINQTIAVGQGRYSTYGCGFDTPGIEYIYAFTPSQNGLYYIQQNSSTISVDFLYKEATQGCDEYGWTCLGGNLLNNSLSPYMDLLGGVTYYIMIDPRDVTGGVVNFSIGCRVATPANDNCDNGITIPVNPTSFCTSSINGTSLGADESAPACAGSSDDDVWYQFTATSDTHMITVTPNTMVNAIFEVFIDDCAQLQSLGCFDQTIDKEAEYGILYGLTPGLQYLVRVYSADFGMGFGSYNICITTPPNPCDSIVDIAACGTPVNTAIPGGRGNYWSSYCGYYTDGIERIFTFTPTDSGSYSIQQNSSFDIINYQFKDTILGCDMNSWNCIGDLNGNQTSGYFYLDAGITYYILLDPINMTGGSVNFQVNCGVIPPDNDNPCNATILTVNSNSNCIFETFSNANASSSVVAVPSCGNYLDNDVWFMVEVPQTGVVNIDTQNLDVTNSGMAVYTGDCFTLTEIACDDNSSSNPLMSYISVGNRTPGEILYIRFWENGGGASGNFNICASTPAFCAPPSSQATNLVLNPSGSTNIAGSFNGTASGYLVIQSLSATPPSTPIDGVTYSALNINTLGTNLTFIQSGLTTTFANNQLLGNTRYFYYVFAYTIGSNCAGPVYSNNPALTNYASTCVDIPNTLVVAQTTLNSFTLDWFSPIGGNADAIQYTVEVSTTSNFSSPIAGSPFTVLNPTTLLNITGLTESTTYYYRIKATAGICSSAWVNGSTYTGYCLSGSSSGARYIDSFITIGGTNNIANTNSGYLSGGYGDFTSEIVSKSLYGTLNFSALFFNGTYTYGFNIWVDWNDDLDFNDAGEKVYASGGLISSASGSFSIPGNATIGLHRMRIKADTAISNPNPCGISANGETEDYTLEVLPLACSNDPAQLTSAFTGLNSAVVSWNPAVPPPAVGYQYYYSTSSTPPSYNSTPSGSVIYTTTSVALNGLIPTFTYYFWVRSNCNVTDGYSAWIGPLVFSYYSCTSGNGIGTSTAGCPDVVAGGLNLNGADPAPIGNCGTSACTTIEAQFLPLGDTTNYTVQSIAYQPPYQYGCMQNPVSINIDDVWSQEINLPFNFCFYGFNYNKCIISSNGAISFDTSSNVPGGYSTWPITANIPNATMFKNTIFGVYQDIHPGLGGQIGWELITLETGCRALVASYRNVPMYSCSSMFYTGMIVLYENTNVIEVYVQEKRVCSSWNQGNAIIGIQDATGTQAVVAPNRNALDADWTTTNEAWRFVPSGNTITTFKWHEGSGLNGPVIATTPTLNVCPAGTTTYTAEVTYNLCNGTILTEVDETTVTVTGNKTWNGNFSTNWNTAANWTPVGIPNASDCVVIPDTTNDPIVSGTGYNALAGNITVMNNAVLTIKSANNITVTDWINVAATGVFQLENSANLIQINNTSNTGNIVYNRTTNLRRFDYSYWSAPVANFNVNSIGATNPSSLIFTWNPTVANTNGGQGNWIFSGGQTMTAAKGYIVRAPDNFNNTVAAPLQTIFTGVPNNGNISIAVSRGDDQNTAFHQGLNGTEITNLSDNWNLIGNPYPSSISGGRFLYNNNSTIIGNLKLWTHGTLPTAIQSPFYGSYAYNYSPGDYLTYNLTGTNCCPAAANDVYVGAGQGFFVQMLDGPAASQSVNFNNALRSATFSNDVFYKNANQSGVQNTQRASNDITDIERHRIWVDLIDANLMSDRTLIGYVEGATYGKDNLFDAPIQYISGIALYSMIGSEKFNIQGRKLSFDNHDVVPLGYVAPSAGNYSIAIAAVDGLFKNSSRAVYLEDKILRKIHNLKKRPYTFTTAQGTFNNRFKLRYREDDDDDDRHINSINGSEVVLFQNEREVTIKSYDLEIQKVLVYDSLGKLIYEKENLQDNIHIITHLVNNKQVLFVKVKLTDGTTSTHKVLY